MKRPLIFILLFLIAGIIMGRYFQQSIVLFFAAVILTTGVLYYKYRLNMILLFPLAALLGFFLIYSSLSCKDADIERIARAKEEIAVEAEVLDVGKSRSGNYKAIVKAKAITDSQENIFNANFKIQAYFDENAKVAVGDKIIITGELNCLNGIRNPGGFDEFQYLRSRKAQYKIFVSDVNKNGSSRGINIYLPKIRARLYSIFDKAFPEKEAAIMKAMIIGGDNSIDDYTQDIYRGAGIYHILSISGFHISILILFFTAVLNMFLREKITNTIMIVFLLFYCVLSGAGIATVRAVIMGISVLTGGLIRRKRDDIVATSFAALCLLIYEPMYLWDVGFQFSFAAVYGLIIGIRALERVFGFIKAKYPATSKVFNNKLISGYLAGTIAVFVMVSPISAYHFYYITPVSILTNIIIAPSSVIIVIVGFAIAVLGLLSMQIASFLALLCILILQAYEFICVVAISIPFSNILTGAVPFLTILSFYLLLGFLFLILYNDKNDMKKYIKYIYISGGIFILLLVLPSFYPKRFEAAMLDVGQGDGIILNKGKVSFIIDGGGNGLRGIGNTTGDNVLEPYLNYKGISTVEAAFVTHTDADHSIGIIEIMSSKKVKRLFLPDKKNIDKSESKYYPLLLETAKKYGTEVYYISAGDELIFAKDILVKAVFPEKELELSDNEGSVVLKISYGESKFLFAGDIGFEAENIILNKGYDIDADVLKIAHHGSRYSSSEAFIAAVSPDLAIISAGINNSYGHPSPDVLSRLGAKKINTYTTPENGAILINSDGKHIFVKTMINHTPSD